MNIIPDLQSKAVPIDNLQPLEHNPRRGNVARVAESLKEYGQHRLVVCRRRGENEDGNPVGEILAGNHVWLAAKELGWTEIAATWVDDDDATAIGRSLADNRATDDSSYDDVELANMIKLIDNDDLLIQAAGYDAADIQEILDKANSPVPTPEPYTGLDSNPVIQYTIIFGSEEEQKIWFRFVRWLKKEATGDTLAERLTQFLKEILPDDD